MHKIIILNKTTINLIFKCNRIQEKTIECITYIVNSVKVILYNMKIAIK